MMFLIGIGLWTLALAAGWMALRGSGGPTNRGLLVAAVVATIFFLFRPQENFLGGEDPGSYINSGLRYAREGSLFYTDPLLSDLPSAVRRSFLYGDGSFGETKAAALWVRDLRTARMGPWFQPAYPLLMAAVARLGPNFWVFYVAPFFALLMAGIVARLAGDLVDRKAAWPAYLFFVLNPVIAWNARCPRPELPAGFFLLAGLLFFLRAWSSRGRPQLGALVLSALCMGAAPFFHVTAWMTAVTAAVLAAVLAGRGRGVYLVFPSVMMVAAGLFVLQLKFVTDCYYLLRFLEPLHVSPVVLGSALVGGGLVSACIIGLRALRSPDATASLGGRGWSTGCSVVAVAAVLAGLVTFAARDAKGSLPFLPASAARYLSLTDFKGVLTLVSLPALLVAVAGWLILMFRPARAAAPRLMFGVIVLPGVLCAGWMNNYMFETRRLVMVLVPVLAIALGVAVAACARTAPRWRKALAVTLCLVVLAGFAHGKTGLYTTRDLGGLVAFFERFADRIQEEDGILLTEYAQFAAPFDHYFGIDGLSLDPDYRKDKQYARAEAAWDAFIMRDPERGPVFYLTPFQPPLSRHFTFVPVMEDRFTTRELPRARRQVPAAARERTFSLGLYRMYAAGAGQRSSPPTVFPYTRTTDGSKLGYRGLANRVRRDWSIQGRVAGPGGDLALGVTPGQSAGELWMFLLAGTESPDAPGLHDGAGQALGPVSWRRLAGDWWLGRAPVPAAVQLVVRPGAGLLMTDAYLLDHAGRVRPVDLSGSGLPGERPAYPMTAQWARAKMQTLMPLPGSGPGCFAFLANASRPDGSAVAVSVSMDGGETAGAACRVSAQWHWHLVRVGESPGDRTRWVTLASDPAWDPGLKRYPHDLGVLVESFAMIPWPEREGQE